MSGPSVASAEPIVDRRDLAAWMEAGCKPAAEWRIGTEHEKFVFRLSDLRPPPYEGPGGIGEILTRFQRFGWKPVFEGANVIALTQGKANISLEPGGQFELSGAPLIDLHATCRETNEHLDQVREIGGELGFGMVGFGFNPKWRREDIPWMPKGRYRIMRDYMPKRGGLGLDMMTRTCTVQVNLDFASEADMVRKFRVSLALQPIATALFANSPFVDGQPTGYQSFRAHVWSDTDPDRTGEPSFVFEDGFDFERYVDYALDTPMYFVYRDGRYVDASGQSFRDFLAGRLPALPGATPTASDWSDHLTTLFPDVRMKRYLEMRGADAGQWRETCALPALWVGLLYDGAAQDAAWDLAKGWTQEDRAALRRDVPRLGLDAMVAGRTVRDVARDVLEISRQGLVRRERRDMWGRDETRFLDPLVDIVESGRTQATAMLERWRTEWDHSVDPAFTAYAY